MAATLLTYRDAAEEAARRAADVLAEWRAKFQVREKGRADLVTDADIASQRVIRDFLAAQFPDHHFLGEEEAA
ncbi:MAG: inositol monophosphatase, partial [Gemmataceae bacterium]|nr:inositol monophosphatase [Gemmataceae bacterium]